MALAAVLTIGYIIVSNALKSSVRESRRTHRSHEDTSTAGLGRALAAEALNLSVTVDLVVLENSQLRLLPLVLDLLGSSVDLVTL